MNPTTIVILLITVGLLGYLVRDGQLGTEAEDIVLAIPFFGTLYERIFKPSTYYKADTTLMFQSVVHAAVLEVVEQLLSAKGARPDQVYTKCTILAARTPSESS